MKIRDGFEQAFNCHAAVDADSQVIVEQHVTQKQNDGDELVCALDQIEAHLDARPDEVSADSGYDSEANLEALADRGIKGYVATGRQKHGTSSATKAPPSKEAVGAHALWPAAIMGRHDHDR